MGVEETSPIGWGRVQELLDRVEKLEWRVRVLQRQGMDRLLEALHGIAIVTEDESRLQLAVRQRLQELHIGFEEQCPSGGNRYDFFVPEVILDATKLTGTVLHGIAVELKTQGGKPELLRQLDRYAADDAVDGMLVVTTRRQHLSLPASLREKPVQALWVGVL